MRGSRSAVSRVIIAVIVLVILLLGGVAAYYLATTSTGYTSTTTSTSASLSSSATLASTSTSSTSGSLSIDDLDYPSGGLNQLLAIQTRPYPDWMEGVMYQTLIAPDLPAEFQQGNITYEPDLASSWTVSSDGSTYTYNLIHGATFSNGDPFNSYQVWAEMYGWYLLNGNGSNFLNGLNLFNTTSVDFGPASVQLLQSSGLASPDAQALAMMSNSSWPIYTEGPSTIVFHLSAPFIWLNGLLSGFQGMIFDSQYVLAHGGFGNATQINPAFSDTPIPGTGPYMFQSGIVNSEVTFVKNPTYWGDDLTQTQLTQNPILDPGVYSTVYVTAKSDDLSRYTDLTTGVVQMSAIAGANFPLLENNSQYSFFQVQVPAGVPALAFNTQVYPTNITDVRQAIAHAINYTQITDEVFFGRATEVVGPASPNYGAYYDPGGLAPYGYNLTEARDYLAAAGFPGGKGLPAIGLVLPTGVGPSLMTESQIIQADLAQIGVNIQISSLQFSAFQNLYGNYQANLKNAQNIPQLTFLGGGPAYLPDYLAPTDYWVNFVTNYSIFANYAIYNNPTVDSDVAVMTQTANATQIVAALKTAEAQVYDDAPYAWLVAPQLWLSDGSFFWNNQLIKQVWFDPGYGGINDLPLFNTVVLANSPG